MERVQIIRERLNQFFTDLTNPASMLSLFILGISAVFIGLGHYLLYRLHQSSLPFMFFLPPLLIMVAYAYGYGLHSSSTENFDGGLISARAILRSLFYMISGSFAIAGFEMLGAPWVSDPTLPMLCFWIIPGLVVVFAVVYGLYSSNSEDIRDSSKTRRNGSGRRSMALVTVMSVGIFLYCIIHAAVALIVSDIWISLASFAGAFGVCFIAMYVFQSSVPAAKDRGLKQS